VRLAADATVVRRELTHARARGIAIERLSLANKNGIRLDTITYGGIITSLHVPDRSGIPGDIVLGFDDPSRYTANPPPPYFGALVGRYANRIARGMVVPPQRDGGQRQYVETPLPPTDCDRMQPVLNHIAANLDAPHTVPDLARLAMMSERTFARRFVAETGTTPHRWIIQQRVLRARELLEQTDLPVEAVASHSGFGSAALLRTHFQSVVGRSPQRYRREFSTR